MRSRGTRALTIVLLLASAFPPPRVVNFLIADVSHRDSAGKQTQARGRNRIGSPVRVDSQQALACLSSADWKPPRPPRPSSRRRESPAKLHRPTPPFVLIQANLRLRC